MMEYKQMRMQLINTMLERGIGRHAKTTLLYGAKIIASYYKLSCVTGNYFGSQQTSPMSPCQLDIGILLGGHLRSATSDK